MDARKTKEYYAALTSDDLCQCDRCQNYIKQIKSAYPLVAEHLLSFGVDIAKPFETWPLEPDEDGYILYLDVQYVVLGSRDGFTKTEISGVGIDIAESHPATDISDAHFVIQLCPIRLKWLT